MPRRTKPTFDWIQAVHFLMKVVGGVATAAVFLFTVSRGVTTKEDLKQSFEQTIKYVNDKSEETLAKAKEVSNNNRKEMTAEFSRAHQELILRVDQINTQQRENVAELKTQMNFVIKAIEALPQRRGH